MILTPMTREEYVHFREEAVLALMEMFVKTMPREAALRKAEEEQDAGLPDGPDTPDNHLYTIRERAGGESAGGLWFGKILPREETEEIAYLFYIVIREPFRRRGLGFQALAAMENEVLEQGLKVIRLHVEKENSKALGLYKKLGYGEYMDVRTGWVMEKRLELKGGED